MNIDPSLLQPTSILGYILVQTKHTRLGKPLLPQNQSVCGLKQGGHFSDTGIYAWKNDYDPDFYEYMKGAKT